MIARINGVIAEKTPNGVIVDLVGIGYDIVVPLNYLVTLSAGDKAVFYIAENIKEDEYTLFGFPDQPSRTLYYKLTSVNGVGPKAAISILSMYKSDEVQNAILKDDVSIFSSVSGIGKKTAQRIILELKGKLVDVSIDTDNESDQAFLALISLGYSARDAKLALKGVDESLSTQERIKLGLKGASKWLSAKTTLLHQKTL